MLSCTPCRRRCIAMRHSGVHATAVEPISWRQSWRRRMSSCGKARHVPLRSSVHTDPSASSAERAALWAARAGDPLPGARPRGAASSAALQPSSPCAWAPGWARSCTYVGEAATQWETGAQQEPAQCGIGKVIHQEEGEWKDRRGGKTPQGETGSGKLALGAGVIKLLFLINYLKIY